MPSPRLRSTPRGQFSASLCGLLALCLFSLIVFAGLGPHPTTPLQTLNILLQQVGLTAQVPITTHQVASLMEMRLPRALMCVMVGAALGLAGTVTQGVFRHPLADPGLLGASCGAALATACAAWLVDPHVHPLLAACAKSALATLGAAATLLVVYFASRHRGTVLVATMILAGLAVNVFAFALVGCITYGATDLQPYQMAVWGLGSFAHTPWLHVGVTFFFVALGCALLPFLWHPLDAMLLGEAEARHLGVRTRRTKVLAVAAVALTTGAAVAAVGCIGFLGLVVPHVCRMLVGSRHRVLLPAAALMGGSLLLAADALARTWAAPTEVPVGLLTALIGAPFLFWLLICERSWSGV